MVRSLETDTGTDTRKIKNVFSEVLQKDTGVESTDELATLLQDRITWKSHTLARLWATE